MAEPRSLMTPGPSCYSKLGNDMPKPHYVTAWGETKNVLEWSRDARCTVSRVRVTQRLKAGWGAEEAIGTPAVGNVRSGMGIDEKVNRLTLRSVRVAKVGRKRVTLGLFDCDCGNEKEMPVTYVKREAVKSCGCMKRETSRANAVHMNRSHGLSSHPLHSTYQSMKSRCKYKSMNGYRYYGGKGIRVDESWAKDFVLFYDWAIGHGWMPGLTIERKDNDGPYSPENCTFATTKEQANNRSTSRKVEAFGEIKTIGQWSEDRRAAARYHVIYNRITGLGWEPEAAITTPPRKQKRKKKFET